MVDARKGFQCENHGLSFHFVFGVICVYVRDDMVANCCTTLFFIQFLFFFFSDDDERENAMDMKTNRQEMKRRGHARTCMCSVCVFK